MSHEMIFIRFDRGEKAPINEKTLTAVLDQFSLLITERWENTSVVSVDPDSIGSEIGIYYDGDEITEIGIDRPYYTDRCNEFACSLITELGVCMIAVGEFHYSPAFNAERDLPEGLEAECYVISKPADFAGQSQDKDSESGVM